MSGYQAMRSKILSLAQVDACARYVKSFSKLSMIFRLCSAASLVDAIVSLSVLPVVPVVVAGTALGAAALFAAGAKEMTRRAAIADNRKFLSLRETQYVLANIKDSELARRPYQMCAAEREAIEARAIRRRGAVQRMKDARPPELRERDMIAARRALSLLHKSL